MLDARNTNSLLQVKYEDIKCGEKKAFCALFRHLSIPTDVCMPAHIVESNLQMAPYDWPLQSDTKTLAWRLDYELSNNNNTKKFLYDITAIQGALTWVQKGDKSKPTYGTPAGLPLQKHMPPD